MLTVARAEGQSLQIGDITVTILDVGDDEVLLRIECPEGSVVEPSNPGHLMESEWRLDREERRQDRLRPDHQIPRKTPAGL